MDSKISSYKVTASETASEATRSLLNEIGPVWGIEPVGMRVEFLVDVVDSSIEDIRAHLNQGLGGQWAKCTWIAKID